MVKVVKTLKSIRTADFRHGLRLTGCKLVHAGILGVIHEVRDWIFLSSLVLRRTPVSD